MVYGKYSKIETVSARQAAMKRLTATESAGTKCVSRGSVVGSVKRLPICYIPPISRLLDASCKAETVTTSCTQRLTTEGRPG